MNQMFPPYGGYPYGYNPTMQPQQQRLAELEQQYPQFAGNNMPPMMQNPMNQQFNQNLNQNFVKCRAVTSIDEAKASMIDLDGSIHVFTDLGNKKIYTKKINMDGTATLNTYALQDTPEEKEPESVDYVSREQLEAVCRGFTQQINELRDDLEYYERIFEAFEKPTPKAQSKKQPTKTSGGEKK